MSIRRHLTFANIASGLALVVALGTGTSYAAGQHTHHVHLPKNSVGSKQLKNGGVKAPDLAPGSVTGATVADGSLSRADVSGDLLEPRAYGAFTGAGALSVQRSHNATVSRVEAGRYCITVTPASGIDPLTTSPLVSSDELGSAGFLHVAETIGNTTATQSVGCPNGWLVDTYTWSGSSWIVADSNVSFLIP